MGERRLRIILGTCLVSLCLTLPRDPATGFAIIGSPDLPNEPDRVWSIDGSEITWKFSANFLAAFPNAQLQNQVRLAFEEWSIASGSAERRNSPRYQWVRSDGVRSVFDLRSTVTHELGHAIGSQHPDASWFNGNLQRNFRYDSGGVLIATPPLGGEIMNEGFAPGTLPNSKPSPGISPGEYWRTLSKDEVQFLDHVYGRKLTFKEVVGNAPATITVTAYNLDGMSNSGALGQGGPDTWEARDPGDPSKGTRILTASFTINANPGLPIGIDPSTGSWDVVNQTGKAIDRLSIRTQGTSNREPLLVVLSNDPNNFTKYDPAVTFELFNFENRGHVFTQPVGGSVPNGGTFGIAMQQDVWDWTVTRATAVATDDEVIPLSLISFVPFYEIGLAAPAPEPGRPSAILLQQTPPGVLARGLKLVNSDQPAVIEAIALADVDGLGIDAADAVLETWLRLLREGRAVDISLPAPLTLGADESFYLLFEGDPDALPRDVIASGHYLVLSLPLGLLDREIFAWARSSSAGFGVQSMALINDEPIVGGTVAVPSTILLFVPMVALAGCRIRRRQDFFAA